MPSKLNAWVKSKSVGMSVEEIVCEALNSLGNNLQSNNDIVKTNVDLKDGNLHVDVKCAFTPYPREETPARLSGAKHLTLDEANIKEYDDDVLVVFAVVYPQTKGLFAISTRMVKEIVKNDPRRIYKRSSRSFKDKIKKIGISLDECIRIKVDRKYIKRIQRIANRNK